MKHKYRNLADMEDDIMLLCQNAREFNEEGSQIYTDSLELENAYLESRAQIDSGLLDFGESGDEDATPGNSQVHVVEVDSYLSDNSDGVGGGRVYSQKHWQKLKIYVSIGIEGQHIVSMGWIIGHLQLSISCSSH